MKVLVFLLSVLTAGPVNDRSIVTKSCQITCSGKADNFSQYNPYTLKLQGNYGYQLLGISRKEHLS